MYFFSVIINVLSNWLFLYFRVTSLIQNSINIFDWAIELRPRIPLITTSGVMSNQELVLIRIPASPPSRNLSTRLGQSFWQKIMSKRPVLCFGQDWIEWSRLRAARLSKGRGSKGHHRLWTVELFCYIDVFSYDYYCKMNFFLGLWSNFRAIRCLCCLLTIRIHHSAMPNPWPNFS